MCLNTWHATKIGASARIDKQCDLCACEGGRTEAATHLRRNRAHQVAGITWPSSLVADWSGSPKAIDGNVVGPRIGLNQSVEAEDTSLTARMKGKLRSYARRLRDWLAG